MKNILTMIVIISTAVSVIFKWRYKILDVLLKVKPLRKMAVRLSMNMAGYQAER